jgi:hypothetical protein
MLPHFNGQAWDHRKIRVARCQGASRQCQGDSRYLNINLWNGAANSTKVSEDATVFFSRSAVQRPLDEIAQLTNNALPIAFAGRAILGAGEQLTDNG